MTDSPCKGCEEREVGCHSSCERYKDWQEVHNAERNARYQQKLGDMIADGYAIGKLHDFRKKQRRRHT